jgi:hypothetical protein
VWSRTTTEKTKSWNFRLPAGNYSFHGQARRKAGARRPCVTGVSIYRRGDPVEMAGDHTSWWFPGGITSRIFTPFVEDAGGFDLGHDWEGYTPGPVTVKVSSNGKCEVKVIIKKDRH